MSFGSQTVGDVVVSKFDMHVYTSVLTSDEIKNLVAKYAIPLDLHPCVPPSGLTMNMLPVDKIGKGGQDKIFNEFCTSLKHWKGRFFLIDRHAISDVMPWRHQNFVVVDPPPTGIPEKSDRQKVVEYESERAPAAKRKAQTARDKAIGKRSTVEGTSRRTEKKKGAPLTFAWMNPKEMILPAVVPEPIILLHLSIPSFRMM
nr:hypothetical protein [Tanacetum cinerariifolium]